MMVRVLAAGAQIDVSRRADRPGDELWLSASDLNAVSGWQLKPEGLCKGEVCVPLPASEPRLIEGELVHASAFWKALGRPVLHDEGCTNWFLGEAAEERARQLATLEAPEFTLPDIDGNLHSLSDHRGKKVLLATWASW